MKLKTAVRIIALSILLLITNNLYSQTGITFTLGNSEITTDGTYEYYEFDILASATENSQFKLAQVYIDYNTAGFGSSIYTLGNVTVTKGELLSDVIQGTPPDFGTGIYRLTLNDNTTSKLSIANEFNHQEFGSYTGAGYELSNMLGSTPKVYARVKIKIQNPGELSGISPDGTVNQFELQQYYYSTPGTDEQANYTPVNVGSGLNEPLPVEMTSFTAEARGEKVELKWETKTEINNYGFEVERSAYEEGKEKKWVKIGFVEGAGNSTLPKEYRYTDKNPLGGSKFIYRLKQIDEDGSFEYSDEVEVELIPKEYVLYQNYPNPFNPATNIKFSIPVSARVSITIYNSLGEKVEEIVNREYEAGYHKAEFNGTNYSSGVYIYRMITNNFVETKKMVLLR